MRFSQLNLMMNRSLAVCAGCLVLGVLLFTSSALAQKSDILAPQVQPPNLDQCANGSAGNLACTGSQWQNGNLNQNQAKWIEGDSVPYRAAITGLTAGSTGNTLTIQWDTTENGKHALDYITSFDRSVPAGSADPCSGVAGCTLASASTFPIPIDPNVTAAGVTQLGGQFFTIYGGTITGVSAYSFTGSYAGSSQTGITITYTANQSNVVIAWGGHIATRLDWGLNNSAIGLSGSPYHMRILGTGNQDRSLSVEAVIYPATVTIVKLVNNLDTSHASTFSFSFTASTNFAASGAFTLIDSDPSASGGGSITQTGITTFGTGNTITVTEDQITGGRYSLADLTCTEAPGGLPIVANTTWNFAARTATIVPDEGEIITCTYTNAEQLVTAAPADVTGRVTTDTGSGIRGANMTLTNISTGEVRSVITNSFGYFNFSQLDTDNVYVLTVASKRYTFLNNTLTFTLRDSLSGLNFIANPPVTTLPPTTIEAPVLLKGKKIDSKFDY